MLYLGRDELAKYPFMPGAKEHLKEYGFKLEQFGEEPTLRAISMQAFERVMSALRGEVHRSEVRQDGMADYEIFTFAIAVVLIKLAKRNTLIRRFALAEARRAETYLAKDLGDRRDRTKSDMARHILRDLFKMEVIESGGRYLIPVPDYLAHSSVFHEREWKLVNQDVHDGFVHMSTKKAVRLVRHALTVYISDRIRKAPMPDMIPGCERVVEQLTMEADRLTPHYKETGKNPPCVKYAMDVLNRGENLPHSGRFMLATFLLARGQTVEEIAPIFKNAPDYNERITMYQLRNLAGGASSGERYKCPGCSKLQTQNLCFAVPECDKITNPTQFGRVRQ